MERDEMKENSLFHFEPGKIYFLSIFFCVFGNQKGDL